MKIRHRDYGEVEGVDYYQLSKHWEKKVDGAHMVYYECDGWSEAKEPRYVDVTGECIAIDGTLIIDGCSYVVPGHNFSIKNWFDLPENLLHEIHHLTPKGFIEYIQRFKKPCLIVEKEEG